VTTTALLRAPNPVPAATLSADEARRAALRAQGLLGAPDRRAGVTGVLRQLGAVQLDTISVLARSHELVPYARLGPIGRSAVGAGLWPGAGSAGAPSFEYWSHAACVLPVEEWPYFAFRRRAYARRRKVWHEVDRQVCNEVVARLAAEGPLTATDLGGAKAGGPWWDWSKVKVAAEFMLASGRVVCVARRGWRRVYDLPERALPAGVLGAEPDDEASLARLVSFAGSALGVATVADLADYHRLTREQVAHVIDATGLVPVTVAGWRDPAWADPGALADLGRRGRHRTTLLSPFDSLIWDRRRTERLFGFTHALEAYKPRAQRRHGYFVMPLLAGGLLVGRVDPKRKGRTLAAAQVSLESAAAVAPMAAALWEAASWVGCDDVRLGRVTPGRLQAALVAAVAACHDADS
jgi:uncharacterized protein YcaQ